MRGFLDGALVIEARFSYFDVPFEEQEWQECEEGATANDSNFFGLGVPERGDRRDARVVVIWEVIFPFLVGLFIGG